MGGTEIIVILIVALLFLGPDKLPQAAKTISKGIRDLKKQSRSLQQQIEGDEQIGGAIRDLKSALRGEDMPTPRKLPKAKLAELPAAAATAAVIPGALEARLESAHADGPAASTPLHPDDASAAFDASPHGAAADAADVADTAAIAAGPGVGGAGVGGAGVGGAGVGGADSAGAGASATRPGVAVASAGAAAVAGPAITGAAVAGPAVAGPAVAGTAVAGPAVAGPAVAGPAVAGPAVAGVARPGTAIPGLPGVARNRPASSAPPPRPANPATQPAVPVPTLADADAPVSISAAVTVPTLTMPPTAGEADPVDDPLSAEDEAELAALIRPAPGSVAKGS